MILFQCYYKSSNSLKWCIVENLKLCIHTGPQWNYWDLIGLGTSKSKFDLQTNHQSKLCASKPIIITPFHSAQTTNINKVRPKLIKGLKKKLRSTCEGWKLSWNFFFLQAFCVAHHFLMKYFWILLSWSFILFFVSYVVQGNFSLLQW